MRDLVKQALRMRPDRIVVGEVRGAEVVDLLAALNTGHDGGAGTVHANSPAEVPARLEALAAVGGLDRAALHSQLAAAVQVVVHVSRDRAGRRRLSEIAVLKAGDDGRVRAVTAWRIGTGFGCGAEHLRGLMQERWRDERRGTGTGPRTVDRAGLLATQDPTRRRATRRGRHPGACGTARRRGLRPRHGDRLAPTGVVAAVAIVGATVEVRRRRRLRRAAPRSRSGRAPGCAGRPRRRVARRRSSGRRVRCRRRRGRRRGRRIIADHRGAGTNGRRRRRRAAQRGAAIVAACALGTPRGVLATRAVTRPGDRDPDADGAAGHR